MTRQPWLNGLRRFDLIYSANTLHIMPWPCVEAFFSGLATVMATQAIVFVYGPFKFGGQHISASNAAFDQSLQARGVGSGVRDFEAVDCLAQQVGLRLLDRISMPANNHCLIWRRLETES